MCSKFARPNSYDGKQSNKYFTGQVRAANATEAAAGTSEALYISPSTLASAVGDLVPSATTLIEGVVLLTDNSSPVATKAYADALAIAGAPAWSESVSGIGQLATTAEAQAATNDNVAMTPLKVAQLLATPPAIGGTTPGAGSFTTIAASGLSSLSGSATILTAGTALNLGSDASADAINVGTGAAARTITIGNVTGATALALNSGTGSITLTSTGTGDIVLSSADTVLVDSAGVLELNSSAGVISIGNDDVDQNINLGTDGERVTTIGSNNGAANLVLESGTGGLDIGVAASAQAITVGNITGTSSIAMLVGTGNFTLDGVAGSTYNIGASTTTGTVTIGGTAQTGNFNLGVSSGIMAMNLATGNGAKTLNVATGVSGNTVNLATGVNTSAQVVNISSGASAANSTVNILSGNGSAGTQTLNALTGTRAGALNLATGAAAHVIAVGSASAGAVTVDTAAGISLDAATASNFTVTGAADLSLISTAGSVLVNGEEAVVDAIQIQSAAGGIDVNAALEINIDSSEAAVADAVRIVASAADGGIDIDAGTGGIAIDSTGAVSIQGAAASDFSTSGAGIDLSLTSAAGRIIATAGEDAADAIYLHANAGTSEKIRIHSDQGTSVDSVELESDVGGITLTSGLASADAINLSASAGGVDVDGALQVNIASSQAAASAIVLSASNAAGGIDLNTGGGEITLSSSGFVSMVPGTASVAGNGLTLSTNVGVATFTGQTTASGAEIDLTITNTLATAGSAIFVSAANLGVNDAQMTVTRVTPASGSFVVKLSNEGAAALNGDIILSFWIFAP